MYKVSITSRSFGRFHKDPLQKLKEIAEVINVFSEKAMIKFKRSSMCSCCKTAPLCKKEGELVIDRGDFHLKRGDRIEVGIEPKKTVLAAMITFLFPAVIFLLGLVVWVKITIGVY